MTVHFRARARGRSSRHSLIVRMKSKLAYVRSADNCAFSLLGTQKSAAGAFSIAGLEAGMRFFRFVFGLHWPHSDGSRLGFQAMALSLWNGRVISRRAITTHGQSVGFALLVARAHGKLSALHRVLHRPRHEYGCALRDLDDALDQAWLRSYTSKCSKGCSGELRQAPRPNDGILLSVWYSFQAATTERLWYIDVESLSEIPCAMPSRQRRLDMHIECSSA
nr:hypothetical protein CFP56_56017 [Quercus suber]